MTAAFQDWTPSRVVALLTEALRHCDRVVEPPDIRDPVADLLRATVEQCVRLPDTRTALFGRSLVYPLGIAQGIVTAASRGARAGG